MIKLIGSIVVALFVMAMPILATLSIAYNWPGFAIYFFTLFTLIEVVVLVGIIYANAEKNEE